MVRKKHKKRREYQCGEILVCRRWMRFHKHYTFTVKYAYEIMRVEKGNITLKYDDDSHMTISIQMVRDNLIHNYCETYHNFQGCSLDGDMMIFE